jgi:glycosyltransferase involved in cell wall biosynthesis
MDVPMETHVGMIVFAYYPEDRRVRREAEALAAEGMSVDVLCIRKKGEMFHEVVDNVSVYRLPIIRKRASMSRYIWEYVSFIVLGFIALTVLHIVRRYKIVHVHNMPDALVLCALTPKITGAKVILDLHDPMPELFITKYSLRNSHPIARLLRWTEMCSIKFSSMVLTPNIAFRDLFIRRGCPARKIHVIMNTPDMKYFQWANCADPAIGSSQPDGFRLMYHGSVFERHGLDTALDALVLIRDEIPNLSFDVYGDGDYTEAFVAYINALHLADIVHYRGFIPPEFIGRMIGSADVGLIPNKRTAFTEINLPTRIFEYLCMGKPVIAPRTHGISDYFDDLSIYFFEPSNHRDLASVILQAYLEPERRRGVLENGMRVYQKHRWEKEREKFIRLAWRIVKKTPAQPVYQPDYDEVGIRDDSR